MRRSTPMHRRPPTYPTPRDAKERKEWGERFASCWVCGTPTNLQVHEIASKAQAPLRWADRRNYFRACGGCNCDFLNWAPEALMLAYKAVFDGGFYDREFVNELRHRAANAISESDVNWWIKVIS